MPLICQAVQCSDDPDWRVLVSTSVFHVYYLCDKHMDNRVYPKDTTETFTLVAVRLAKPFPPGTFSTSAQS